MDQKNQGGGPRYISFFIIAMTVLLVHRMLFPPPAPVAPNNVAEANGADAEKRRPALDALLPRAVPAADAPVDAPAYVALGSIDPGSPYRMHVTLASKGGVVHRVQLASPKYRDIDYRGGHLGDLEARDTAGGILVEAVPAGSPAAAAGLQVGDIITAAGRTKVAPVAKVEALKALLDEMRPKQTLQIEYQRNGVKQTTSAKLIRAPLDLIRPEAENILLHSSKLPDKYVEHPSCELELRSVGPVKLEAEQLEEYNQELRTGIWAVETPDSNSVIFRKRITALGLEFVKRFTLAEVPAAEQKNVDHSSYHFDFAVEVRNLAAEPQTVVYTVQGPSGLPIEGWWYSTKVGKGMFTAVGIRDVVVRVFGQAFTQIGCPKVSEGDTIPVGQGTSIAFAGVDAQYFAAAVFPQLEKRESENWVDAVEPMLASPKLPQPARTKYNNASFTLLRQPLVLAAAGAADSEHSDAYRVFAGPKKPALLDQYYAAGDANYSISDFLYYGWFWWVAKPMLWLLHSFAWLVGNYGIAIIMLTVLVRGCMFPVSLRQSKNMAKMQELKPELDRIAAKYKDDRQKQMQAQQELWRQHNFNPMGGCLPMFIQLPIFIGLYRSLAVDVELRQTPLFSDAIQFCSNLAAPDMLFDWSSWWWQSFNNGEGMLYLGPYLNALPLVTVGLFLLQQKLFMPPPTDEQTAMTQKIMQYMMIFMSLMFFKVASGLCLYFIASSLWGIAERKLIGKPKGPAVAAVSTTAAPKRPSGPSASAVRASEVARRKKRNK